MERGCHRSKSEQYLLGELYRGGQSFCRVDPCLLTPPFVQLKRFGDESPGLLRVGGTALLGDGQADGKSVGEPGLLVRSSASKSGSNASAWRAEPVSAMRRSTADSATERP